MLDDEGEVHELYLDYFGDEGHNKFKAIEFEALERGIRYADTISVQFDREVY